ncbi:cell division protein SepF [Jeotgalibacillus malaysiensis]|uniref:Cell division protein SepF n=1 Tax=Jeotgalibacillus malaysiensis TaxID=1508404 RepID=A0A0B5ASD5_9BACL|nr:cell division protein SepF [Jeotgalibacillus malaysiensis]AJD90924.1 cell division protein SepF [Jeotgalibacillus malaysiensis]
MGMKTKFKDFFFGEEEEYMEEVSEETPEEVRSIRKPSQKQNVVSLQSVQQSSKMVLMEPRMYAEAQEIADHLKSHRAVVVNLQRISKDQAKRIVDFLSGTVYAIGGDIQRVGTDIFLCTPDNIEVSGNITDLIQED